MIIIDTSECDDEACGHCGQWWSGWVGNTVHVVPVNDIHQHTSQHCPCRPVKELVVRNEGHHGFMGWNVVHNSFDGREAEES